MVAMEPPARSDLDSLSNRKRDVFAAMPAANPDHYIRGQHDGYERTTGVAAGSTTETFSALRLDVDNWRWSGVPFFIRAGKLLPLKQTEVRVIFRAPPSLDFSASDQIVDPNEIVLLIDPRAGTGCCMPNEPTGPGFGRSIWMWTSAATVSACRLRTRNCCTRRCEETRATSAAKTRSRRPGGSWTRCLTCQVNPARMPRIVGNRGGRTPDR
jgi:Glucose-6-phosphate dehydrogenase, C-terminal domain